MTTAAATKTRTAAAKSPEVLIPFEIVANAEPVRIQVPGIRFWMGKLRAVSAVMPIQDIVQLSADAVIYREDFKLHSKVPGNRLVRSDWVETIKRGLSERADHLLMGTFIFAVDPAGVSVATPWPEPDKGQFLLDVARVGLRSGHRLYVLDAQHRSVAITKLWNETVTAVASHKLRASTVAKLLKRSSVPAIILLEKDEREIRRMFVTMASTRPVPAPLVAAMDEFRAVNRLGLMVGEKSRLFKARIEIQATSPRGGTLYTASVLRAAASVVLIGFKDRTPRQRDDNLAKALKEFGRTPDAALSRAADWIAGSLDYAATKMPGWKEIMSGKVTPEEAREKYLLGSGAALYVIAAVIAACRLAEIDYKPAIDVIAELPWKRHDVVHDGDSNDQVRHRFFEGMLVHTSLQKKADGSMTEIARAGGGSRTQYQNAAKRVLEHLATDRRFAVLGEKKTFVALGIESPNGHLDGAMPEVRMVASAKKSTAQKSVAVKRITKPVKAKKRRPVKR